jgi:hypothetical protein
MNVLTRVNPWALPRLEDCIFYHSISLPDGERIVGDWEIADGYLGGVSLDGRRVLDVGTAGGAIAFAAERDGATVTAMDVKSLKDQDRVPFVRNLYLQNKAQWATAGDHLLQKSKSGFWYCWHRLSSKVSVCYENIFSLYETDERFDVVIGGAIIEHLADPVSAIGGMCRVADEAVLLAFTPVDAAPGTFMRPLIDWNPEADYVWWVLSKELYIKIFDGLGFDTHFRIASAIEIKRGVRSLVNRTTIVAVRRK